MNVHPDQVLTECKVHLFMFQHKYCQNLSCKVKVKAQESFPIWSNYSKYPKNWATLTTYHTCPETLNQSIWLPADVSKTARPVANSVDPDQMQQQMLQNVFTLFAIYTAIFLTHQQVEEWTILLFLGQVSEEDKVS